MFKRRVLEFFNSISNRSKIFKKPNKSYVQGVHDCMEYFKERIWHKITDEESYPKPYEFVMVVDEFGRSNIAFRNFNYCWYISNGERVLKITSGIVKWIELD